MRRPLMFISISFALGILLGHYLKPVLCLSIYLIIFLFFALGLLKTIVGKQHEKFLAVLLTVSLLGTVHLSLTCQKLSLNEDQDGQLINLRGRVISQEDKGASLALTVKIKRGPKYLVWVKGAEGRDYLGDTIKVRGKVWVPDKRRNPGLFDYSLYLKTKGIAGGINAFESNVSQDHKVSLFLSLPAQVKEKIIQGQKYFLAEDKAGLLAGIIFGDKTDITDDIYESFQTNGTAHILAVSGIHVSIIYAYIAGFFKNKRGKSATIFIILFLLFYCALADFSPSVVRAVSMIIMHLLARQLHRRYDFPSAIACSALIMLLYNPYNLFNMGFQMSYTAVLALSFALPHFKENKTGLASSMVPLICVQTAMAPLIAFHFMYFSFSAFLVNVPIIFLAGLVVPLGLAMGLFSLLPSWPFVSLFLETGYRFVEKSMAIMIWLNKTATATGLSHMNVRAPSLIFMVLFYGLFFFLLSESSLILIQQRRIKAIKKVLTAILILAILTPLAVSDNPGQPDLVFVDVGQGDCLHIRAGGKNILIDGGGRVDFDVGKRILKPYLLKNGVKKIDLALVTHLHHDHYDGIATLCREMPVAKLGVYEGNLVKLEGLKTDTGLKEENFLFLAAGDLIKIDDQTEIQIIYPRRRTMKEYEHLMGEGEDENLNSLVFMVCHKGARVMITGDMTEEGEAKLMSQGEKLNTDILKIGHHGSKFSSSDAFLDATGPLLAIIQVGRNNYGHPHDQIIEKLGKRGIMIYRNDLDGAVLVKVKKDGFKVRTML